MGFMLWKELGGKNMTAEFSTYLYRDVKFYDKSCIFETKVAVFGKILFDS